jgi:hypothetical protein
MKDKIETKNIRTKEIIKRTIINNHQQELINLIRSIIKIENKVH